MSYPVFFRDSVGEFNRKIAKVVEEEFDSVGKLLTDPVLCFTEPEVTREGEKIILRTHFKFMERSELPPVVRVGDD